MGSKPKSSNSKRIIREYLHKEVSARVVLADSYEYLKKMDGESVDLIVTSPPYNIGKEYEKRKDYDVYIAEMSILINELVRVLKPDGAICWQVGNGIRNGEVIPLDALFYPLFKSHNLIMRNRIIWSFGHGLHAKKRFSGRHETIMWFTKSENYKFNLDSVRIPSKYPNKKHYKGPNRGKLSGNPMGKNPSDVWEITNVKALHPEKTDHPCQFPVALVDRLIKGLSNPGDLVLDPFSGAGTTLIAAAINGRKSIGIEISANYVKLTNTRLKKFINGSLKWVSPLTVKQEVPLKGDQDVARAN